MSSFKKKLKRIGKSILTGGTSETVVNPIKKAVTGLKDATSVDEPSHAGIEGAMSGLDTFGQQASEEIAGLKQSTGELLDTFDFNPIEADFSGLSKFTDLGEQGVSGLSNLMKDPSSILQDPLIQAQLQQGIQASEGGAAAGGTQLSGGQLKELQGLGNVFAGTQIDKQFDRFSGLAKFGMDAEKLAIGTDVDVQRLNQSGQRDFNELNLAGQEQFANLGLAGIGLRGDIASQKLQTESDLLTGARGAEAAEKSGRMGLLGNIFGGIF